MSEGQPYILICLDVDMSRLDGNAVLKYIRKSEEAMGIVGEDKTKILMTTAVSDKSRVIAILKDGCDRYLLKPFKKERLAGELKKLGFASG